MEIWKQKLELCLMLQLTLPGGGDSRGDGEELVEHPEGADPLYCGETTSLNYIGQDPLYHCQTTSVNVS